MTVTDAKRPPIPADKHHDLSCALSIVLKPAYAMLPIGPRYVIASQSAYALVNAPELRRPSTSHECAGI